ncbi:hypothetical protein BH20ACT1_BH20ACT1_03290 [soil metagenome]
MQPGAAAQLGQLTEVVCMVAPSDFMAVGVWYEVFDQTSDETVRDLLDRARWPLGSSDVQGRTTCHHPHR